MKRNIPFILLAGVSLVACKKSTTDDHPLSKNLAPLAQNQYLSSLRETTGQYNGYFQYDDSMRASYLEYNQAGYINSLFVYYAGTKLQSINTGSDSLGSVKTPAYSFTYDPSFNRIFKIQHLNDGSYDSIGFDGLGRVGSIYHYSGNPLVFTEYDSLTIDINNDLITEYKEPVTHNYVREDFTYDTVANPFQKTNLGFVMAVTAGLWEDLSAHNMTSRVYNKSSPSAPTPVVTETDTDVYTYGSNGLPVKVTETQANTVTGTIAVSFNYNYLN